MLSSSLWRGPNTATCATASRSSMTGFAVLIVGLVAAAEPKALSAKQARRQRQMDPIVLTISGGVSLGAYEAGFDWTLLRFMKMAELLGGVQKFPLPPDLGAAPPTPPARHT